MTAIFKIFTFLIQNVVYHFNNLNMPLLLSLRFYSFSIMKPSTFPARLIAKYFMIFLATSNHIFFFFILV